MRGLGGVDEAGRGPVIGPMVIAIAATDDMERLRYAGIKDSKELSPESRVRLMRTLKSMLMYVDYEVVDPGTIDNYVLRNALNKLEAEVTARLIRRAMERVELDIVYVDSPDPRADRYGSLINELVGGGVKLVSMNRADKLIPIVSAASIVAKVVRDSIIENLRREYGDFGSGYPSDPRTIDFLRNWVREHGELPPIVRRSWSTVRRIVGGGLDRFL